MSRCAIGLAVTGVSEDRIDFIFSGKLPNVECYIPDVFKPLTVEMDI